MEYDLSPIPVDELMLHKGLGVEIRYRAHQFDYVDEHPESRDIFYLREDAEDLREEFSKRHNRIPGNIELAGFEMRMNAEDAEIARSRLRFGMQVCYQLGKIANIAAIRVIGAESRLEHRAAERGIRDLDLSIDLYRRLSEEDITAVEETQRAAHEETGIPIDIICPGMRLTADNFEHLVPLALSGMPLKIKGFPLLWREEEYLQGLLSGKIRYFEMMAKKASQDGFHK